MKTQNGIIYSGHSSARDNNCERWKAVDRSCADCSTFTISWLNTRQPPSYRQNDGAVADFIPPTNSRIGTPRREIFDCADCHKRRVSSKLNSSIVVTCSDWILVRFLVIVIVEHVDITACMWCSFRRDQISVIINFWKSQKELPCPQTVLQEFQIVRLDSEMTDNCVLKRSSHL